MNKYEISIVSPVENPEPYLNLIRVVLMTKPKSFRPIAFQDLQNASNNLNINNTTMVTSSSDFINHLSEIRLNVPDSYKSDLIIARINSESKGIITAGDLAFEIGSGITVCNPEIKLAENLGHVELQVYFRRSANIRKLNENFDFIIKSQGNGSAESNGIVPFASNHNIISNFAYKKSDGKISISIESLEPLFAKDQPNFSDLINMVNQAFSDFLKTDEQ